MVGRDDSAGFPIQVALAPDNAVVLFELLSRLLGDKEGTRLRGLIAHDAELWALDELLGGLERQLVEPLRQDYQPLLADARARLSQKRGAWPQ